MPQQSVPQGLNWGQVRAIITENATDVEQRLAQIETGGVQIISNVGAPASNAGNVGDYYIDSSGYNIYGPKTGSGWPAPVSMSGFNPRGVWASTTQYAINDVISHQNSMWVAVTDNINDEPRDASAGWDILARGDFFRGEWVSGTVYRIGHTARHSGSLYRAKTNDFTSTVIPPTDTGNWDLIAAKGDQGIQGIQGLKGDTGARGLTHRGNYVGATTYAIDDTVVYRSKLWRRLTAGSGVEPTSSNVGTWQLIAGWLHYVPTPWAAGTEYRENDVVKYNADMYRIKTNFTSTATTPNSDTTNYELFMQGGGQGPTGPAGQDGEDGSPGATGPQGPTGAGYTSGFLAPFAGNSVPTGWVECDGQPLDRVAFASLFNVIGTVWGIGDGSTTFNVPDLRGRVLVDDGTGAGLSARVLAEKSGVQTVTLTVEQIPNHQHKVSNTQNNNSTASGGGNRVNDIQDLLTNSTAITGGNHSDGTTFVGGGASHDNMPPYAVVKYIIKV